MSEHTAIVRWSRGDHEFAYEKYSRDHTLEFDNGATVKASSAPTYFGDPAGVDPEEMLVAALSSCHMLTFLAVAAKSGYVVERYEDHPVGFLEKNAEGRLAVTRASLHPRIEFGGDKRPDAPTIERMHAKAHANCFIANSVRTVVTIAH